VCVKSGGGQVGGRRAGRGEGGGGGIQNQKQKPHTKMWGIICITEGSLEVKLPTIWTSQNVKSTTCSDHFWKLRCRKSARRCGTKHVCK